MCCFFLNACHCPFSFDFIVWHSSDNSNNFDDNSNNNTHMSNIHKKNNIHRFPMKLSKAINFLSGTVFNWYLLTSTLLLLILPLPSLLPSSFYMVLSPSFFLGSFFLVGCCASFVRFRFQFDFVCVFLLLFLSDLYSNYFYNEINRRRFPGRKLHLPPFPAT